MRGDRPERRPAYELEVEYDGQPTKEREYHVISRMGCEHNLGVYNNGVDTVERSFLERYFLCEVGGEFLPTLGTTAREWKKDLLRSFRRQVIELVRPQATVLTLREVVKCYTGPKRRIYENAERSLMRVSVNKSDSRAAPFTKFEKQDLSKAPRMICPRSPRYNLCLGKYLKKLEKPIFEAINEVWGGRTTHTVIKGLNVFQSAAVLKSKWDRFKRPVAVGADAKKFDMHVEVEALEYEHGTYNEIFESELLATLLKWQLINFGVAYCPDGVVRFKVKGKRLSGDLNTSLGNSLLMCAMFYELTRMLGIDAELANNGDDCVLIMEEEDLELLLRCAKVYFERMGFRMTFEKPVRVFEEVEFCQSRPVEIAGGWAMVRNVRTCLQKDPICLVPLQNDKVYRKWLGAVGECGLATVPGCPVLQSFYRAFERSGVKATKRFKHAIYRNTSMEERVAGLSSKWVDVSDESRASFYRATGITPDYQLALEHYYDRVDLAGFESMTFQSGVVELATPEFLRHL